MSTCTGSLNYTITTNLIDIVFKAALKMETVGSEGSLSLLVESQYAPLSTNPSKSTKSYGSLKEHVDVFDAHPGHGRSSTLGASMNLTKAMVGAGMLALPHANAQVGWVMGIFTLLFGAVATYVGYVLLARCAQWMDSSPTSYGRLCRLTYPSFAWLVDLCILVSCYSGALSYLIIVGDLLPSVTMSFGVPEDSLYAGRTFWITTVFLVLEVPLTCLRRVDKLSYTSALGVMGLCYVVILSFLLLLAPSRELDPCFHTGAEEVCRGQIETFTSLVSFLRALPTYLFAFGGHFIIFDLYDTLRNVTVQRLENQVFLPSMSLTTAIYAMFGLFGYFTFGSTVKSNILVNYPDTAPVTAARLLMSVAVAVSYPLVMHATRSSFMAILTVALTKLNCVGEKACTPRAQELLHWASTVLLLGSSYVVVFFVHDLGVVVSLAGILCGVPICFILPGTFYCKAMSGAVENKTWKGRALYASAMFLVVFGVVFLPLALWFI
eukprot:comp18389_c0_seq1/m.19569 comp18389_c0_seq1/g.19569  ORF comp18389_c0_seq1/g.19569 comp18389_c0_seq1/m.19569 type:complete len:493 (-) comp18389_c0_seq1:254-1732(-)